jgi:hypothetical protein
MFMSTLLHQGYQTTDARKHLINKHGSSKNSDGSCFETRVVFLSEYGINFGTFNCAGLTAIDQLLIGKTRIVVQLAKESNESD